MVNERQEGPEAGGPETGEGEMFRLLAENVKDYAIFMLDGEGRIQTWTSGAERLLGYREEEILGQGIDIVFTPEDRQNGVPQWEIAKARSTGRGEDDRWHVRKDGSWFWASGVLTPLLDDAGGLRGFAKIMRDQTQWKQLELARLESEASKAAVLEMALDGIITIDHQDRIIEFNPAAERLFGYHRSAVLGQRIGELIIPHRFRSQPPQGLKEYLTGGQAAMLGKRLEMSALRADETEFPVELTLIQVPSERAILFTGYIRDVSERKTQERRTAAQLAVTRVLAEAPTVREAAPRILEAVCEGLDWDVGRFWRVDLRTQELHCLNVWHQPTVDAGDLEDVCRQQHLELGRGLPGRVARDGQPLWMADATLDEAVPALALKPQAAQWSAFATPLVLGDQVLGVAEFLSQSIRKPDADLLGMMATIGGQIGQFMQRKYTEEALRQSEERFRGMMEQAPFSIQVFSHDGQTLQVNRAWEQLWGISAADISDYNILQDPQLATKGALGAIARAFTGEVVTVPAIYYDPNETVPERTRHQDPRRWVTAVAYPLRDSAGKVREVILVHEDITARKQAEDALRESEERFRGIVSHSVAGVAEVDLSGRFLFVNDRYCEIVGRSRDELLTLSMQDISHQDDVQENRVLFDRIGRDGHPFAIERRYLQPDGTEIWVNNSVSGLRDQEGRVTSIVAVCVDVTERKRTEQDLRFLADASRSLATLVDPKSALQRIAGLAVPHFADWCAVDLPEGADELRQLAVAHVDPSKIQMAVEMRKRWPPNPESSGGVHQVFRRGESVLVENVSEDMLRATAQSDEHFEILRALGLRSYMCVPLVVREKTLGVITFVAAESGRRYNAADLAVAEDLARRAAIASDNANLYAAIQEEGRRKDEFLAMLAHELRNPLAPIRSGLDLLGMMDVEREVLEMMQQQVEHLVRLVDDLLDVSRIMRGKVELRREPTELSSIIARVWDTVRPLVERHHQHLSKSVPRESIWLDADPIRLAQVMGNLLNNASKYTEPGGEISLSAEPQESHVLIRVRDTGIGIRSELLPHVFDLFTQDQRTIDRSQGGLGIGLTVAKSLIEMHGGTITATSEGPGRGSEFVVRLPTISPPQQRGGANPESVNAPPLRILVVDDNVAAAKMLELLLTRLGQHQVMLAHDGVAAVAAAKELRPDLVLLDIGLPRLDGFEVARQLRQDPSFHHLYLVALTGYGTDKDRRKSLEAGFDEHLVKPPRMDALQKLLVHAKPIQ